MLKNTPDHHSVFRLKKSSLIQIVVLAIAIAIIAPQVKQFSHSWSALGEADLLWASLAVLTMTASILFAGLVYLVLVPSKLPLRRTMLIQLATYFTNRLLPSGLGGIGFNALYLVKQAKLTRTDAAVYATANNIIGFLAFSVCSILAAIISHTNLNPHVPWRLVAFVALGLAVIFGVVSLFFKNIQKKIVDFLGHLVAVIITIVRHPKRLFAAVICSMGITATYAATLWLCARGVGVHITVMDLFLAFVVGNAAMSVSPTPGGLGAVEAAIIGVFVAADITPSLAFATVVLFRLVSYWLPILPGYIAFRYATRHDYV